MDAVAGVGAVEREMAACDGAALLDELNSVRAGADAACADWYSTVPERMLDVLARAQALDAGPRHVIAAAVMEDVARRVQAKIKAPLDEAQIALYRADVVALLRALEDEAIVGVTGLSIDYVAYCLCLKYGVGFDELLETLFVRDGMLCARLPERAWHGARTVELRTLERLSHTCTVTSLAWDAGALVIEGRIDSFRFRPEDLAFCVRVNNGERVPGQTWASDAAPLKTPFLDRAPGKTAFAVRVPLRRGGKLRSLSAEAVVLGRWVWDLEFSRVPKGQLKRVRSESGLDISMGASGRLLVAPLAPMAHAKQAARSALRAVRGCVRPGGSNSAPPQGSATAAVPALAGENAFGTIVTITNQYAASAGGRTASIFRRARLWEQMGCYVVIASFLFASDYIEVFRTVCKRYGVRTAEFANIYEYFCEEPFYHRPRPGEQPLRFVDFLRLDEVRQIGPENLGGWRGDLWCEARLRGDFSCNEVRIWQGESLVQIERYDRFGHLLRRQVMRPGTEFTARVEFLSPQSGRVFLTFKYDEEGALEGVRWDRLDGSVQEFSDERELRSWWIAAMDEELHPCFVAEQHAIDASLLENPFAGGHLSSVCMLHSNIFDAPYRYGSELAGHYRHILVNLDRYDAVVTLTGQEAGHIQGMRGAADNVYTIPHPVERVELGKPPAKQEKTLVLCARLEPVKRIDHAIMAMERVRERVPEARLVVYGTGSEEARLRTLAAERGLVGCVEFRGYTDRPLAALAAGQLSVSTSVYEGFGLSTLEAMMVGTPVVSYDYLYGPRDIITDGVDGVIVPGGDIEALACAIASLLEDPERLSSMQAAAPKAAERFDDARLAAAWRGLFRSVRERRPWTPENIETVPVVEEAACALDGTRLTVRCALDRSSAPGLRAYAHLHPELGVDGSGALYVEGAWEPDGPGAMFATATFELPAVWFAGRDAAPALDLFLRDPATDARRSFALAV